MPSPDIEALKAAVALVKKPLHPDMISWNKYNPYGLRADIASAVATILNAAPALIEHNTQLSQDNRAKDAVIMSQEGQIDQLRQQLATAKAVGAAEWQPIETAPKDQWIDLWCANKNGEGYRTVECRWSHDFNYFHQACAPAIRNATHWRPIPEPPAKLRKQAPK
jgi:hypothetical protein